MFPNWVNPPKLRHVCYFRCGSCYPGTADSNKADGQCGVSCQRSFVSPDGQGSLRPSLADGFILSSIEEMNDHHNLTMTDTDGVKGMAKKSWVDLSEKGLVVPYGVTATM